MRARPRSTTASAIRSGSPTSAHRAGHPPVHPRRAIGFVTEPGARGSLPRCRFGEPRRRAGRGADVPSPERAVEPVRSTLRGDGNARPGSRSRPSACGRWAVCLRREGVPSTSARSRFAAASPKRARSSQPAIGESNETPATCDGLRWTNLTKPIGSSGRPLMHGRRRGGPASTLVRAEEAFVSEPVAAAERAPSRGARLEPGAGHREVVAVAEPVVDDGPRSTP